MLKSSSFVYCAPNSHCFCWPSSVKKVKYIFSIFNFIYEPLFERSSKGFIETNCKTNVGQALLYPCSIPLLATLARYPCSLPLLSTLTLYPYSLPLLSTRTLYPYTLPLLSTLALYPCSLPLHSTLTFYPFFFVCYPPIFQD